MGSKVRAKWKQKLLKDKGSSNKNAKLKETDQQASGSVRKIEKLLKEAEVFLETFDYESARKCCQKALHFNRANIKALEMLASTSLDLGDPETAYTNLMEAVKLSPEVGHSKYFSLAQLGEGRDALRNYQKGIDVAIKGVEKENSGATAQATTESISDVERQISDAYCSMAEVYMTDLCFEADAEAECKSTIEKAIQTDPSNPEAIQCLANFQLTIGQMEDAQKSMSESLALWLPKYREIREGQVEATNPNQECALSYDSRVNGSKILIELEMFDEAGEVLDGLIDEDDEVVDVWYLLGWSNYLRSKEFRGNARFYFNKAKEVAHKLGEIETPQFAHMEELLAELGPESEDEDENEGPDDDEADSDEDEEMEQESSCK